MAPTFIADSTFDGSGLALAHHWVQPDAISNVKLDNLKHRNTGKGATVKAASPPEQADAAAPALAVDAAGDSAAAQFQVLCNDGSTWTWSNCWTKLMRFSVMVLKQIYLLFVTMSLPTNHLMVSPVRRRQPWSACSLAHPGGPTLSLSSSRFPQGAADPVTLEAPPASLPDCRHAQCCMTWST